MSSQTSTSRLTLRNLQALFTQGEKLTMLTAYDAVTAALVDQAGVEMILVGDSLGNVVLGFDTTIPVKLDDMIRHAAAVVRGTQRAWVICDLPFGTTHDAETALKAAIRVFQETGCQAVKIEGGASVAPTVKRLTENGIPVVAHIGLTPQSIHQLGGYYRHGKTSEESDRLIEAAIALQDAGAAMIVLECLTPVLAASLTRELKIPTIGIGSGEECSGQVLVINDLIGLNTRPVPKFARPRAEVATIIRQAAKEYLQEVKQAVSTQPLRTEFHSKENEPCPTGSSWTSATRTP